MNNGTEKQPPISSSSSNGVDIPDLGVDTQDEIRAIVSQKNIQKVPFASQLIKEVAPEIGASVWLEPEYGFVGEITFKNGKKHLFRNTNFNINPLGSVEIARDKGYACVFLERANLPVVFGINLLSSDYNKKVSVQKTYETGVIFLNKIGFPAIIKPNNLSQGAGVYRIDSMAEYKLRLEELLAITPVVRLEKLHSGNDYRVVMLDGNVISAYQRFPLAVIGDEILTISQLLMQKQQKFQDQGRDTVIDFNDDRITHHLQRRGYTLDTIPKKDEVVTLLDNANLSTGGESFDITEEIHPDFVDLARKATQTLGLRLAGVDILADDLTLPLDQNKHVAIIELNGAPGLDNYMSSGETQRERVKDLYREILRALEHC